MRIIADLHIHSAYSRATSKEMTLPNIALWAARKGINLVGTGDFTHPGHFADIERELVPTGTGLFQLKSPPAGTQEIRFMLTSEVSNIYSTPVPGGKKTRKIHSLIFAPSLTAVKKMNDRFGAIGNIKSDGRPIFGFSAQDLIKIVMASDPDAMLIPAHAWTPWFSIFGSKSGFDTIEECFGDYAENIYAIETGLSSDPQMNARLGALDALTLISNSDAHSPRKLGREANVLDCSMDYYEIMDIIKRRDKKRFKYTIEFYPEQGKYHGDGHRACDISMIPEVTRSLDGICPKCDKPLTLGVLYRVMELSERPAGFVLADAIPSRHLVPLEDILSATLGKGVATKTVQREYMRIIKNGGSEFSVLLDLGLRDLVNTCGDRVAEAIIRVREGNIKITPGYDGEFGKIHIFDELEKKDNDKSQIGLFENQNIS